MKKALLISLFFVSNLFAGTTDTFSAQALAGHKCQGGEIAIARFEGAFYPFNCSHKEWMVLTKNNLPVIVKLKALDSSHAYRLVSTIPVRPEVKNLLRKHYLVKNVYGEWEVTLNP